MPIKDRPIRKDSVSQSADVHQGDCVQIQSSEDLFQVIGVDSEHERCWIRRWPLLPKGSPVFEIPIQQIARSSEEPTHCSVASP